MTVTVPKVVGHVAYGHPTDALVVSKIVGYVIYDTNTPVTPPAGVRKKVIVRGRILPGAS